jgi:hypothetical protein
MPLDFGNKNEKCGIGFPPKTGKLDKLFDYLKNDADWEIVL